MSRIRHRDIVARLAAIRKGGMPPASTFWSFTLSGETEIAITVQTLDEAAAPIVWGDGTFEFATHNVEITHTFQAGSYIVKIGAETNIKTIDISGNTGVGGVVDTTAFTALQGLDCKDSTIADIVAANFPATLVSLNVDGCGLSAEEIDDIITTLQAFGESDGVLSYDDQSTGAEQWAFRSASAQAAQIALESNSWTVTPENPWKASFLCHFDTPNQYVEVKSGKTADGVYDSPTTDTGVFSTGLKNASEKMSGISFGFAETANLFKHDYTGNWVLHFWFKNTPDILYNLKTYLLGVYSDAYAYTVLSVEFSNKDGTDKFHLVVTGKNGKSINLDASPLTITDCRNFNHVFIQHDGTNMMVGVDGKIRYKAAPAVALYDESGTTMAPYVELYVGQQQCVMVIDEVALFKKAIYTGNVNDDYDIPSTPFGV